MKTMRQSRQSTQDNSNFSQHHAHLERYWMAPALAKTSPDDSSNCLSNVEQLTAKRTESPWKACCGQCWGPRSTFPTGELDWVTQKTEFKATLQSLHSMSEYIRSPPWSSEKFTFSRFFIKLWFYPIPSKT